MALTRKKAIVFSIIPTLLFLFVLFLAEAALRLFVPSLSRPLIVQLTDSTEQVNRAFLDRFFPASSPLIPELKPAVIRAPKPAGLFRVLCLGESSMFGVPYEMTANIPGMLRKQLRQAMPGREVEVINLASSAINTNVIKVLAEESLPLRPDLVVIYTGHNEFYGPDGIGASFLERAAPFLTAWKYRMRDVRLVRLFQNALRNASAPEQGEKNLMKQVSNNALVDLDSDDAAWVFSLFERNLREILSTYRDESIPVIVSDVSSNLKFSPFAFREVESMDRVPPAVSAADGGEAEELLDRMTFVDSTNAFLWYWRGRLALAHGDSAAARTALRRARDLDLLKFRAPEEINAITRRVCGDLNVPCVSADSLFASLSPGGIPGDALFWEHLHPKVRGYYEIAQLFFREASRQGYVGPPGQTPASILPFNTDTLGICWLDQAYADLSIRALTSRWPFEEVTVEPAVFPWSPERLKQVALDVYNRKLGWAEGCVRSAGEFHRERMFRGAMTTYQAMLDEYGEGYYTRYLLGTVLRDSGDVAGAVAQYEAAVRLNPEYPYARVDLGLIEINRGNLPAAQHHLSIALELSRKQNAPAALQASVFYGLGAIEANRGDFAAAVAALERSLQLLPSYAPARALMEALLQKR